MQIHRLDYTKESKFYFTALAAISLLITLAVCANAQIKLETEIFGHRQTPIRVYDVNDIGLITFVGNYIFKSNIYETELESDSIAFAGDSTCYTQTSKSEFEESWIYGHSWIDGENEAPPVCTYLVAHDEHGCPTTWPRYWRICRICLRKERVQEVRIAKPKEKSEFELLDERVAKLLENK